MTDYERIEAIMANEGIRSLRSFAATIGASSQNLYDIKSGKCHLSKSLIGKIQEKYKNISPSWLTTGLGEMIVHSEQAHPSELQSLMNLLESQQETIKTQAKVIDQQSATIQQLIDQQKEDARTGCPAGCAAVAGA